MSQLTIVMQSEKRIMKKVCHYSNILYVHDPALQSLLRRQDVQHIHHACLCLSVTEIALYAAWC